MPFSQIRFHPHRRALMLAASILALTTATARADAPPSAEPLVIAPRTQASATRPDGSVLKRLPAGREELTFRGEIASHSFSVVLGRGEVSRVATFQLALRNTVSALPERSAMTIAINGKTLATLPANAADKTAVLPVAIPAGLLVPGPNSVQVTAALTHRVDCSIPATYELWATLDPAQTGFLVPGGAADPIGTVADLAAAPLAEDGTTRIHLRMNEDADEAEVGQAARALQDLVRRAKLIRPVVEVGPEAGTGPGFDVVVGGAREAMVNAPLAKVDGMGVGRDPASGRTVVAIDPDAAEDQHANATQTDAASPALPRDGFRKTFAELGRTTDVFTGRRYVASLPVTLPSDFISTNDRARLRLDGGHSATLIAGDGLALRVNGTLVSYMPLAAGQAEKFDHRELELPLRFFHPGRNEVTVEGTLLAEADAQCKTVTMPREARLTIADTSELEFPGFAHLTTIPQIPVALVAKHDLPIYMPGASRAALGAGFTVLANLAAEGGVDFAPRVQLGAVDTAAPGLVIASADQLPASLAGALREIAHPAAQTPSGDASPTSQQKVAAPPVSRLTFVSEQIRDLLRSRGFFFGNDKQDDLALGSNDVLVAAIAPGSIAPRAALDLMPRFTQDPTHWLVMTAANASALDGGLKQLAASGRWDELRGEAVRFDPTNDTMTVRQPHNVTYVLSSQVAVGDMRPILGGLMSDNILMSLAILFVIMGALGVSTHAVIRRMGVK